MALLHGSVCDITEVRWMPVSDRFVHAHDWEYCEMCEKCKPMPFCPVIVENDDGEKRWYSMCVDCRVRCRTDSDYERHCTDKVFRLKLGIRVIK